MTCWRLGLLVFLPLVFPAYAAPGPGVSDALGSRCAIRAASVASVSSPWSVTESQVVTLPVRADERRKEDRYDAAD
jgi:hypothetical protein